MDRSPTLLARVTEGTRHVGYVLIGLGIVTACAPAVSTGAVVVVVGLALLVAGGLLAAFGWRAWAAGRGPFGFVAGGFTAACGVGLVASPVATFGFVTMLVAVYCVVSGLAQMPFAGRLTKDDGQWWVFGDALLSIALGASMWTGWPLAGERALGILVGIKMASAGIVVLRVEHALRRVGERLAGVRDRLGTRRLTREP